MLKLKLLTSIGLICLSGLISCRQSPKNKANIPQKAKDNHIRLFEEIGTIENNLSKIASDVEVIPLEFTKGCALSRIRQLEITPAYIFVAQQNGVFQFNRKGQFIQKIGKTGKGPGEYPLVNVMRINQQQQRIHILPARKHSCIITYDFKGNFISENRIEENDYTNFDLVGNNYFAFSPVNITRFEKGGTKLIIVNQKGETVKKWRSAQYPLSSSRSLFCYGPAANHLWQQNGISYFHEILNDTIYRIEPNELIPEKIVAGEKKIPLETFHCERSFPIRERYICLQPQDILNHQVIFETENYLLFRCSYKGSSYFASFNKSSHTFSKSDHRIAQDNSKKTPKDNLVGFYDDMVSGLPFIPQFKVDNNRLATVFDAYQLKSQSGFIANYSKKKGNSELLKITNQLKSTDNPVLFIATLKTEKQKSSKL